MARQKSSVRAKGSCHSLGGRRARRIAGHIYLHDIGHGPFSHSLEHSILADVHHEHISSALMQQNQRKNGGQTGSLLLRYLKTGTRESSLHQLVSSQLDMDRLDYLRRDSFYTGVSEGTVGIERIIQMLNVRDNADLIVDQKGIYSVEKFLMARRFMYWQVYLHKTSIAADPMLLSILRRAKYLIADVAICKSFFPFSWPIISQKKTWSVKM